MTKSQKIKTYFKDLFFCLFKTSNLFKFAFYSWITPLLSLIFVCALISLPSVINYNRLTYQDVTSDVLYLDKVLAHTLSQDIKCHVEDQKFICDEGYSYEELYEFKNDNDETIKYKIIINKSIADMDFSTGNFGAHFDTDNYVIFFETTVAYRYTHHDSKTEKVIEYPYTGFYDNLDGVNFDEIYNTSLTAENSDEYLLNQSREFIFKSYKAVMYEGIFTLLVANIGLYLVFILIVGLLLKGNYMLRRKKGFKYSQTIKIALVASLQSALIALVLSAFGLNFMTFLGFIFVIRILYIYFKYTGSRKNTEWIEELYKLSNDERFNV